MFHNLELQEGAYIISDAHYSHLRPELLSFIKKIHSGELEVKQLILMGDVFDALFGNVFYTYEQNQEMIDLLNAINTKISIIFLEGNHDFNLKNIFPQAKVYPISKQPVLCTLKEKKIALAHGDFDAPLGYKLYTSLIRNSIVLYILNKIDRMIDNKIMKKIDNYLGKKDDCKEFRGFESYIKKRELQSYNVEYFIEGHYHQNRFFDFEDFHYVNLGAFACNQRYFVVKLSQDNELVIDEESHQGDFKNG